MKLHVLALMLAGVWIVLPLEKSEAGTAALGISRSADGAILQWAASAVDYRLALTDDLVSPDWSCLTRETTVSDGQNHVGLFITGSRKFYQLRHRGAVVPFTTCEAEATGNTTTGTIIRMTTLPSSTTSTPELEASGRAFVALTNNGEHLDFPNAPAANTLVIRHCIPDAPTGGGSTATLSLYVNGLFRQSLALSSRHNWLYGTPGSNGQSDDPSAGTAHVFWDEARFFITGGVQPGDTLRLQKDAGDSAALYLIDLIDLETAPDPFTQPPGNTYLSVADYGAMGNDTNDDTTALNNCIKAAKTAGKSVWIPAGTYYQNARVTNDSVIVRGAGMWHTRIIGTVEGTSWGGNIGFILAGNGAVVSDLSIDSDAHTRRTTGGKPFTNNSGCTNWRVENVWITHTLVGFWMNAANGVVRGCRVRNTYADAINLQGGARSNLVEHCHVRGCGDDGLAILSETGATRISTGNTLRFNTVIANWWGHNCDLAGGGGHVIEDNYFADNSMLGCFTINLPGSYPMHPITGAIVRRNTIVRGGGNLGGQRRGAIWIFPSWTTVGGVILRDNEILDALFRGIHLVGNQSQNITFERNVINHPGQHGIYIESSVLGSGVFTDNVVRNLNAGYSQFSNSGGADYSVTLSGNSWP